MAIKDMIGPGIGFNPGSVKFIVTRGLGSSAVVTVAGPYCVEGVDVYRPGAVARDAYLPGAPLGAVDAYMPGAQAVEVCN